MDENRLLNNEGDEELPITYTLTKKEAENILMDAPAHGQQQSIFQHVFQTILNEYLLLRSPDHLKKHASFYPAPLQTYQDEAEKLNVFCVQLTLAAPSTDIKKMIRSFLNEQIENATLFTTEHFWYKIRADLNQKLHVQPASHYKPQPLVEDSHKSMRTLLFGAKQPSYRLHIDQLKSSPKENKKQEHELIEALIQHIEKEHILPRL